MNRKLCIFTKCRIVIDTIRRMTLRTTSRQCWTKLSKINGQSLKCLWLKSLWNPALTTKKAHWSIVRGNKRKLKWKVIPKKNKPKRKVHWVTNRQMGIWTRCRIVIDMIRRLSLQTKSRQCCKKVVKMNSLSLKCLRLKSLWNPALTHSSTLRGHKEWLQAKMILEASESKRRLQWLMKRNVLITKKYRIMIDMISTMTLETKTQSCKKLVKMKSLSLKGLISTTLWYPTVTTKKCHLNRLRGNKYRRKKSCEKMRLWKLRVWWNNQSVTKQKASKQ